MDEQGNVFVADTSDRIQKFTNDGAFLTSWGSSGTGDGQFNFPRGLSTDELGNLYVADRNNHRMQKFTGTGSFLTAWGSFGPGEGQFNLLRRISPFIAPAYQCSVSKSVIRTISDPGPMRATVLLTDGRLKRKKELRRWPAEQPAKTLRLLGESRLY